MNLVDRLRAYLSRPDVSRDRSTYVYRRFKYEFLKRVFPAYLGRPVTFQASGPRKIRTSRADNVGSALYLYGSAEWEIEQTISHLYSGRGAFVDVGAHIGSISLHAASMARSCGGTVAAFEPNPTTSASLKHNLQLNHAGPVVTVHDVALSDRDRVMGIFVPDPRNTGTSQLVPSGQGVDVQCRRLDDVIAHTGVEMIKIDVEGHEEEVLLGASGVLATSKPIVIFEKNGTSSSLLLKSLGYTLYSPTIQDRRFQLRPMSSAADPGRPGTATNLVAIPPVSRI